MRKTEFIKIADAIKTYYPSDKIMPNEMALELWYDELKDLDYSVISMSLRQYVATNKFPPTIADLRKGAIGITDTQFGKSWSDGWEQFNKAVRRFGYYRQAEALDSMDKITRQVVKRLGWKELCMSEEQMANRANFRIIYEQLQSQHTNSAVLPKDVKLKINQMQIEG